MQKPRTMGNMVAPSRFVLFFVVLVVASLFGVTLIEDEWLGLMLGFDVAAVVFLLSFASLIRIHDPAVIERQAAENDANRREVLAITGVVMVILLVAIAAETVNARPEPWTKLIIVVTLLLAWLFSNSMYALHYAHMAYVQPAKGCHGLDFPNTPLPVYWDFIYFAFAIGMTFQTSDVIISSDRIRRVVTVHSFAAFIFNIGVLAFTINVIGSS